MAKTYLEHKDNIAKRMAKLSVFGRDIGAIPKVVNAFRKEQCRLNFKLFCETYFPAVFHLAWSPDHLRVIEKIENAVLHGGLFAIAMPRASGKTALCIAAAEWSLLYGHRNFVVLIGASEDAAVELLDKVKADFETNDLLLEDFPEVCYPIRALDGIVNRAKGQLIKGEQTRIEWTNKALTLPTVKDSAASGSIVRVAGITGRIRGMMANRPSDGATLRPSLVIVDDPQTDESAHSPQQNRRRLGTIKGAILGLAGPGEKITGFMPCTVICKGDLSDSALDQKLNPIWQGERIKMMKALPTDAKLWEQYAELRANGLREGKGLAPATEFYIQHKAALDAGAVASWLERFNPDEASAIQHAMNLKLTDEESFYAEYQNEPLTLDLDTTLVVTTTNVAAKITSRERNIVPANATKLTAFIDVQKTVLYYTVCAWANDFSGAVIDYGTYPEQGNSYFTLREIKTTLQRAIPHASFEAQLYEGLKRLTTILLSRQYKGETGGEYRISRDMIDANWGESTSVVKQFVKESNYSALLLPSHGVGITADRKPMNEYTPEIGVRSGWNWRQKNAPDRHIRYDTNAWKTFIADRLLAPLGEAGSLTLFKASETQHRMFCEHVTSESCVPTAGMGRVVNIWRLKPNRENHYLDCLVGCAVAASEQGILFTGHQPPNLTKRKRRKLEVSF